MVKKINPQDDFTKLAEVLNQSFATVAEEFGLTKENAPTNNAFISGEELKSQLTGDREFYVYEEDGKPIGFIAIERSPNMPDTFFIEKLAVIPDCRHLGIGIQLMNFASERITKLGGKRISIGLINSNETLKEWYAKQGYVTFEIKTFEHLPFDVCLMERNKITTD